MEPIINQEQFLPIIQQEPRGKKSRGSRRLPGPATLSGRWGEEGGKKKAKQVEYYKKNRYLEKEIRQTGRELMEWREAVNLNRTAERGVIAKTEARKAGNWTEREAVGRQACSSSNCWFEVKAAGYESSLRGETAGGGRFQREQSVWGEELDLWHIAQLPFAPSLTATDVHNPAMNYHKIRLHGDTTWTANRGVLLVENSSSDNLGGPITF